MPPLIRPRQAYYLIGVVFLLLAAFAGQRFYSVRLAAVREGLTQVVVPGSGSIRFPAAGHGTVFLEYRSVIGNRYFLTGDDIGPLALTLVSATTGQEVPLDPAWVPYSYTLDRRSGRAIRDFWVDQPGTYDLVGSYPPGTAGGSMVVAIGYGLLGDLTGEVAAGLSALGALIAAALLSFAVVWGMRQRYRRHIYGRFSR